MPKCLDCGNTTLFWYQEIGNKLGRYDQEGNLEDVQDDYYDDVSGGECYECQSTNVEGRL